uniref:Peptidase M12B domain-containing protein n=1 Tax=Strongyloides venezuelensis TaxID=75913 RepID=A0A0K0FLE6_STRVS
MDYSLNFFNILKNTVIKRKTKISFTNFLLIILLFCFTKFVPLYTKKVDLYSNSQETSVNFYHINKKLRSLKSKTSLAISHEKTNYITSSKRRRNKREPAIWGEPAGDYSIVVLEDRIIYLHGLLFVDNKISKHYQTNEDMKNGLLLMIQEANEYFYQLNVRIIIVDILETNRSDLSLYTFESYRNSILNRLPKHDFAVLVAHKYAGGLAFVGGLCNERPIMLCGFYSQKPEAMGSIFFHEVGHLVGLPHIETNKTLIVPNCKCKEAKEKGYFKKNNCLKIPGYDHECTVQSMANHFYGAHCINYQKPYVDLSKVQPVCGNGLLEGNEECDCGTSRSCININCNAKNCKRYIKIEHIIGAIVMSILLISIVLVVIVSRTINITKKEKFITKICIGKYQKLIKTFKTNQNVDHSSVLIDKSNTTNYNIKVSRTLTLRPKVPPPPPPLQIPNCTIKNILIFNKENDFSENSSGTSTTTLEIIDEDQKNTQLKSASNNKILKDDALETDNNDDTISWKFEDFSSSDEESNDLINNNQPSNIYLNRYNI